MNSRALVAAAALAVASSAGAQDTRASTTLRVPPSSKSPVVADAAMNGDVAAVRRLIRQGANVDAAQPDGMTALHWAADRGDSAIAAALLGARASTNATTRVGSYTPLHIAAKNGRGSVVRALVKAGADVKVANASGATPVHFAAASGDTTSLRALIDKGADLNAREAENGQTPLVFAASIGRADAVRMLLKAGANPSLATTPINLQEYAAADQAAARKRNAVLVSFEPERHVNDTVAPAAAPGAPPGIVGGGGGAGAQARGPQPKGPFTPAQIQAAIDSGRTVYSQAGATRGPVREEVDTINGGVAGFANAVGGVGGLTPLHHAVRQGNHEAVIALLDGGADVNQLSLTDRTSPLLLATINGHFDIAMTLIKRGANVNLLSSAGAGPLYATINTQWRPRSRFPQPHAAEYQKTTHLELMEALLKAGADPDVRIKQHLWYFAFNNCGSGNCGLENLEGTTPFWRATYAVDVDAMRLLVKYGADPKLPSQRAPGAAGGGRGGQGGGGGGGGGGDPGALVTQAAFGGQGGQAAAQAARGGGGGGGGGGPAGPPLDPAIDSAARAVPPGIGVYPVHAAAGVGYGNGFAGNSHRHAPDGWLPAMKYLVEELGMDVNQRDQNGMTAMHHAASRGDNEMILYLVSKGGDVKAVSRRGQTTVDLANGPVQRLRPFPETIALLEKLGAKNSHRCVGC